MSHETTHIKLDISFWAKTGFWAVAKEIGQEHETQISHRTTTETVISETNVESSCEGDILVQSSSKGDTLGQSNTKGDILNGSCEGDILDPSSSKGDISHQSNCKADILDQSISKGDILDQSCSKGDILDGSCEGDILDPTYNEGNYKSIIMPAVVDVESDCESDILDKLANATYKDPGPPYQNMETHVAGNNSDASSINISNTTKSLYYGDYPNYENNNIVSKNENFDSSFSNSDSESIIFPKWKRKKSLKLDNDSSDSVDTTVYIKENQKITEVKSRNKKKLIIPYKLYNNEEKSIEVNPQHEKCGDQNVKHSSKSEICMHKPSIDDDNQSTLDSNSFEDESFTSIVMPAPIDIGNDDLESFLNKSLYSEDVLDQSFDDSHLITIVMPATENVDSECGTDILEVDFPEANILNNDYGSTIESTVYDVSINANYNSDERDPTFREMMLYGTQLDELEYRNTDMLDSCFENSSFENISITNDGIIELPMWKEVEIIESDYCEEIASFYAIPYNPAVDYSYLANRFSAFKTICEFFD